MHMERGDVRACGMEARCMQRGGAAAYVVERAPRLGRCKAVVHAEDDVVLALKLLFVSLAVLHPHLHRVEATLLTAAVEHSLHHITGEHDLELLLALLSQLVFKRREGAGRIREVAQLSHTQCTHGSEESECTHAARERVHACTQAARVHWVSVEVAHLLDAELRQSLLLVVLLLDLDVWLQGSPPLVRAVTNRRRMRAGALPVAVGVAALASVGAT